MLISNRISDYVHSFSSLRVGNIVTGKHGKVVLNSVHYTGENIQTFKLYIILLCRSAGSKGWQCRIAESLHYLCIRKEDIHYRDASVGPR